MARYSKNRWERRANRLLQSVLGRPKDPREPYALLSLLTEVLVDNDGNLALPPSKDRPTWEEWNLWLGLAESVEPASVMKDVLNVLEREKLKLPEDLEALKDEASFLVLEVLDERGLSLP